MYSQNKRWYNFMENNFLKTDGSSIPNELSWKFVLTDKLLSIIGWNWWSSFLRIITFTHLDELSDRQTSYHLFSLKFLDGRFSRETWNIFGITRLSQSFACNRIVLGSKPWNNKDHAHRQSLRTFPGHYLENIEREIEQSNYLGFF